MAGKLVLVVLADGVGEVLGERCLEPRFVRQRTLKKVPLERELGIGHEHRELWAGQAQAGVAGQELQSGIKVAAILQPVDEAPVHRRLIHWLEDRGDLDPALEFLPSDAGLGLTSPEFSVLVAYAKLALKRDLLQSALPDEPWFQATLTKYFPNPIRENYQDKLASHPLRREIITNACLLYTSPSPRDRQKSR